MASACGERRFVGSGGMVRCLLAFAKETIDSTGQEPRRSEYFAHLSHCTYAPTTWAINLPKVERWAAQYISGSPLRTELREQGRNELIAQLLARGVNVEKILSLRA